MADPLEAEMTDWLLEGMLDWGWDTAMGKIKYGTTFGEYCQMLYDNLEEV